MLKIFGYSFLNVLMISVFVILFISIFSILSVFGLFDATSLYDYLDISTCAALFFAGFIIARGKSGIEGSVKKYLWLGACILAGSALPYFGTLFISHSFPQFVDWIYFVSLAVCGFFGVFVRDRLFLKHKRLACIVLSIFFVLLFLPFLSLDLETYSGNRLIEAVKADDFGKVKKVVTSENVNYVDETGATPIMWAAYNGNEGIINFLIKNGADVRKEGFITIEKDYGTAFTIFTSPLDAAAAKGRLEAVQYLIEEAGLKPDENQGCFNSLLLKEKDIENFDKVVEILEKTDNKYLKKLGEFYPFVENDYPISQNVASFLNAMYIMTVKVDLANEKYDKFLLRRIANNRKKIDEMFEGGIRKAESYEFFIGENGETPLITAIREWRGDVAAYLLSKGADVNYKDCSGNTPLSVARKEKRPELIEMLLKNGAKE